MSRTPRARRYRSGALFMVTTGTVLMALALGLTLREVFLVPDDTWPAWTTRTILLLAIAGGALWLAGWMLSQRAHAARHDTVRTFLDAVERERVVVAVRDFERTTSGEIHVHLQAHVDGVAQAAAARVFNRLGMARTRDRNGVLFFVGVQDRRFAVIGDSGIHEAVPLEFWKQVAVQVEARFSEGRYADGLVEGIRMAGAALVEHFPPRPDDINELPDGIST